MPNNKPPYMLPFKDIYDLVVKVDKIKEAYAIQKKNFMAKLDQAGVKYKQIGNYSLLIDIPSLTKEQAMVVKSCKSDFVEYVYGALKVRPLK
jgi:hypothetical protein